MHDGAVDPSAAVTLRRGQVLPLLGFGTWQIDGDIAYRAVLDALELGYRHIDTATIYGNEAAIGSALVESGVARESVFVTTKVPGNATDARATLEQSLSDLRVDFVDLWLLHWPPSQSYEPTPNTSIQLFEEMVDARDSGLTRAVGVSNFSLAEIDHLIAANGEAPEVNQIPWSPFRYFPMLSTEPAKREIVLEGYSPLHTSRLDDPRLVALAAGNGVTPAQVILRWHLQHRIVVIPRSTHRERIAENAAVFDFCLDDAAMKLLDHL